MVIGHLVHQRSTSTSTQPETICSHRQQRQGAGTIPQSQTPGAGVAKPALCLGRLIHFVYMRWAVRLYTVHQPTTHCTRSTLSQFCEGVQDRLQTQESKVQHVEDRGSEFVFLQQKKKTIELIAYEIVLKIKICFSITYFYIKVPRYNGNTQVLMPTEELYNKEPKPVRWQRRRTT